MKSLIVVVALTLAVPAIANAEDWDMTIMSPPGGYTAEQMKQLMDLWYPGIGMIDPDYREYYEDHEAMYLAVEEWRHYNYEQAEQTEHILAEHSDDQETICTPTSFAGTLSVICRPYP